MIIQVIFIASCAKVEVTAVSDDGEYFYFENQVPNMQKLVGYDSINKLKVDVIREGPSGYWVGKMKIWWSKNGKYYYGYRDYNRQKGDWQPGDILKSKRCAENGSSGYFLSPLLYNLKSFEFISLIFNNFITCSF